MCLKQKAVGIAAAVALGLTTIGAATIPASAAMIHGGGGGHGGGGFHGGGAFRGGGGFHGGMMGGQHFAGGGRFHGGGAYGHYGHHYARYGGFGGYNGYYGGGPYYDCGSPFALLNPYVCSYPYGYY